MTWEVLQGDCLELMRAMPENSVDAIVTDPPYGLGKPPDMHEVLTAWLAGEPWKAKGRGFMGKEWDAFVPGPEVWREAMRVLKPGGHALVFAGSRTVDVMGLALRLAGFEIRDQLQWLYGSGFPKSMDVSKAIDKSLGAKREVVGTKAVTRIMRGSGDLVGGSVVAGEVDITAPATAAAAGWGTALKPAHEPIVLVRKPFTGTVGDNFTEWGTGAVNVDGCRVEAPDPDHLQGKFASTRNAPPRQNEIYGACPVRSLDSNPLGRWPANICLDEEAGAILDAQAGNRPGMKSGGKHRPDAALGMFGAIDSVSTARGDDGGPSRFFYTAKTSKRERNAGLEDLPVLSAGEATGRADGSKGLMPRAGAGRTGGLQNPHPTVKPIELMRWLCRLITPHGGLILDPFTGSGSTGCAAVLEGFRFVGCELSDEYADIARRRIAHWSEQAA